MLRIGIRDDPDLLDPTFSRTYVGTVVMTALCDKQRRAAYQGVWQQESKDLPIIYLWTPRNIVGLSRKVAGFSFLADGLLRLQDVRPAR